MSATDNEAADKSIIDVDKTFITIDLDCSTNQNRSLELENVSLFTNPGDYSEGDATIKVNDSVNETPDVEQTITIIDDSMSEITLCDSTDDELQIVSVVGRKSKSKTKRLQHKFKLKRRLSDSSVIVIDDDDDNSRRKRRRKRRRNRMSSSLQVLVNGRNREGNNNIHKNKLKHLKNQLKRRKTLTSVKVLSNKDQFVSSNLFKETSFPSSGLRPIVIDGSNVAMQFTQGRYFAVKALKICIDYFVNRGHKVYAFVPAYRLKRNGTDNQALLQELVDKQLVFCTASREVLGKKICSYDDRILVQVAAAMGAIIVSSDNYRDLVAEDNRLAPVIEKQVLMPMWVEDMIVFPDDPLGRNGPKLNEFLKF